jgi:hypothetical protein
MPKSRSRKFADFIRFVSFDESGTPSDVTGLASQEELNAISVSPTDVSDQDNTATGYFDLPAGTTAQRPESPTGGMIRYNLNTGKPEVYDVEGWSPIATPPVVSGATPSTFNGDAGTLFTLTGTNFTGVPTVKFITQAGVEHTASSVTRISSTELTATTPINFTVADEPLSVKVINPSQLFSVLEGVIDCGGTPTWSTSEGQIGTPEEGESVNIQLSAGDPDGATVTYSVVGTLPQGLSLNSQTGVISGTAPAVNGDTNNSFSIEASDGVNTTVRPFSILVREFVFDGTTEARAVTDTSQLIALSQPNGFYYVNDGRQTRRYYVDCTGAESGEAGFMRVDSTWATYYNGGACINGGGTISANGIILANTNNGGGGPSTHGGCGVTTNVPFRATKIRLTDISYTGNGNWGGVNFPDPHFFIVNADTGTLSGNYYGDTYPGWGIGFSGDNLISQRRPSAGTQNLGGDYFVHTHLGVGSYSGGTNRPCQHRLWFKW